MFNQHACLILFLLCIIALAIFLWSGAFFETLRLVKGLKFGSSGSRRSRFVRVTAVVLHLDVRSMVDDGSWYSSPVGKRSQLCV